MKPKEARVTVQIYTVFCPDCGETVLEANQMLMMGNVSPAMVSPFDVAEAMGKVFSCPQCSTKLMIPEREYVYLFGSRELKPK